MGIQDLNPFIRDKCPEAMVTTSVEDFVGTKIAVDLYSRIKTYSSVIHTEMLYKLKSPTAEYSRTEFRTRLCASMLQFILAWHAKGIFLIFVKDGPTSAEKAECCRKRSDRKAKIREKIQKQLDEYNSKNPLDLTPEDDKKLLQVRAQSHNLMSEDYTAIDDLIRNIGVPLLIAEHDAEKLCSSLVIEGKAVAVLSDDTDNYVLGAHITITDYELKTNSLTITLLDPILQYFAAEFCTDIDNARMIFRDFCIMCGCDFNERIPRIGPMRAIEKLKKSKTLEVLATEMDISCLNYQSCRKIFSYSHSRVFDYELNIDWDLYDGNVPEIINSLNAKHLFGFFRQVNRSALTPTCVIHENGI